MFISVRSIELFNKLRSVFISPERYKRVTGSDRLCMVKPLLLYLFSGYDMIFHPLHQFLIKQNLIFRKFNHFASSSNASLKRLSTLLATTSIFSSSVSSISGSNPRFTSLYLGLLFLKITARATLPSFQFTDDL